jgi:hypothetical protein
LFLVISSDDVDCDIAVVCDDDDDVCGICIKQEYVAGVSGVKVHKAAVSLRQDANGFLYEDTSHALAAARVCCAVPEREARKSTSLANTADWCALAAVPVLCRAVLRPQEEAAAKLAKYRAEVQTLLASIRSSSSSSTTVDAQLLYRLADQLFASSINPCEFVEMGGVPVVLEAVRSLTRALGVPSKAQQQQQQQQHSSEIEEEPGCQQLQEQQAAAMPAMLQVR